jgi:hypothetical protein
MNIDEGFVDCGENLASFEGRKTSGESPLISESAEVLEARWKEIDFDQRSKRRRDLGHVDLI